MGTRGSPAGCANPPSCCWPRVGSVDARLTLSNQGTGVTPALLAAWNEDKKLASSVKVEIKEEERDTKEYLRLAVKREDGSEPSDALFGTPLPPNETSQVKVDEDVKVDDTAEFRFPGLTRALRSPTSSEPSPYPPYPPNSFAASSVFLFPRPPSSSTSPSLPARGLRRPRSSCPATSGSTQTYQPNASPTMVMVSRSEDTGPGPSRSKNGFAHPLASRDASTWLASRITTSMRSSRGALAPKRSGTLIYTDLLLVLHFQLLKVCSLIPKSAATRSGSCR